MFLVVWGLLLLAGVWFAGKREHANNINTLAAQNRTPHWTAARDLPLNWRISEADLNPVKDPQGKVESPEVKLAVGKYARSDMAKGNPIFGTDLAEEPSIPATAGIVYLLPLAEGAERALNAGSLIDIFERGAVLVRGARVAAVRCPKACQAIVAVTGADEAQLKKSDPAKLDWILRQ
jgi:hypothetical protein